MNEDSIRWYRSRTDWWIALCLCVPPTASAIVLTSAIVAGRQSETAIAVGVMLLVFGIYMGLIFPMRYGLNDQELTVRFGLCRQRIPLHSIREVRRTRNPLSSPALSLDRLHVQFGDGFFKAVMISPLDRDEFLDDIRERAGLVRDGERLIRQRQTKATLETDSN